jgi:hypothetical protein
VRLRFEDDEDDQEGTAVMSGNGKSANTISASDGSIEMMDITPDFAEELLRKRHPHQRNIKEAYVDQLANAMTEGRWRWTADPVRLDSDLFVIDGQHRLSAIVKSGVTLKDVLVATVSGKDAILSIDQGKPRTLNDMRATRGQYAMSRAVSGAIIAESCDWSQWRGMPRELQLRTIEECPFVADLETLCRGPYGARRGKDSTISVGSLSGALRCLRTNREDAMKFFQAAFSMNPIIDGRECMMVRVLYTFLAESKLRPPSSSEERVIEHAFKSIQAYNHWKTGREVSRLLWKGGMPSEVVG